MSGSEDMATYSEHTPSDNASVILDIDGNTGTLAVWNGNTGNYYNLTAVTIQGLVDTLNKVLRDLPEEVTP